MKRQLNQDIVNHLAKKTDFVTSEQLASEMSVSKSTIVRRIADINQQYEEAIILSERGRGYKLDLAAYQSTTIEAVDTIGQRCNEVIKELLLLAPKRIRTHKVYDKFYVSESVIKKDKVEISKALEKWNLQYVRSSRHLAIEGDEKDIRSAIMEVVLNLHQATDINALEEYCRGINNNHDFQFAVKQIDYAASVLGNAILYPYNVSLFAHIYVLLGRIRAYKHVSSHDNRPALLKEEKLFSPEVYSVCRQIIDNIGVYLGFQPDDEEVRYLFEYLSSARLNKTWPKQDKHSLSSRIAQRYLTLVSKQLQKKFSSKIVEDLEKHIHYMVQRLFNHIRLPNALLQDIRIEYRDIFEAIRQSSEQIASEFDLSEISEDESGFVCLYFAKYMELDKQQLDTYVVCTTGIGTSELIAVKVKQTFPMINIVGVTSSTNINKILERMDKKVDLLISTVPIEQELETPVVIVSAILTNRDVKAVNRLVEELTNEI